MSELTSRNTDIAATELAREAGRLVSAYYAYHVYFAALLKEADRAR